MLLFVLTMAVLRHSRAANSVFKAVTACQKWHGPLPKSKSRNLSLRLFFVSSAMCAFSRLSPLSHCWLFLSLSSPLLIAC